MFLSICKPKKLLLTTVCIATTLFLSPPVQAADLDVAGFVSNIFADEVFVDPVADKRVYDAAVLQEFYTARGNKLFWHTTKGSLKSDSYRFIELLEESWTHGLNPDAYHLNDIRALKLGEREKAAELDVLLTDAFVRYVRSISGMRVDARTLGVDESSWLKPYTPEEAIKFLSSVQDFRDVPNMVISKSGTYNRLREELIKLVKEGGLDTSVPPISFSSRIFRPTQYHKNVVVLRERLGVEQQTADPTYYDDRLAGAVMQFQREQGLKADGVIGPQTLHNLNRTKRDKALQLIANLERLRWKPEPDADRFVVVNVPSAMLWAIEDGQVALEMPVVVGKPKRQTKIFISKIKGVRVNPDWTVPPTVKMEDIIPAAMEDPNYFNDRGIKVYTGYGADDFSIDTTQIPWDDLGEHDFRKLRMVQPPSRYNPLGRFRVLMPNKYNIYLHDTNEPHQFKSEQRARSSGCVRMSEPQKMAEFILKNSKWTKDKSDSILASGRKADLITEEELPVYVFYYTIWVNSSGKLVFGHDIYGQDDQLIQELESLDGFEIPSDTIASVSKRI